MRRRKAVAAAGAQQVGGQQRGRHRLPSVEAVAVEREQEGQRPHQLGGDAQERRSLARPFTQAGEIGALQMAQAAVDRLQAVPGSAGAEVARFDQRHGQSPLGRVPGRRGSVDAPADHEQVVLPAREPSEVPLHLGRR